MRLVSVNCKVKEYLNIIPLGDIHFGSVDCDVDLLKANIDWIKKHKKNTRVILMGDIINAGLRSSIGAGSYDDQYNPQEQFEKVITYLEPIKDQIICVLNGNHEERIRNVSSFDVAKLIAKTLGVPYAGYSVLVKVKVNKYNYVLFATHGSTSSRTIAGKMTACKRTQEIADADVYLYAHTHALANEVQSYKKVDFKNKVIVEHKRYFVLTGNFVNWDGSYGEKKNYPLLKKGVAKVKLFGNRRDIHVSL